ncbi:MBL fold metallo-hydrolase [Maridesulfovibrio hydrothermalis]|uniref:Beta-lactamase domain protein n=1 Tax=Maridesulfovibrio hydrothermalis AM13 = DSM 14728 TaxID=1121451 RepID=L0RCA5_9BACT|nr:MBL fold metallo-hydrolase [Maridesulfovibrio hydrothermalis]CCO23852.1 Beta-lactamase domain protein [Maridesulfovibrio hydrothermalis AM13 = DSM 14728]
MNDIAIETFVLGPLETNCYLLTCGKDAIVIDCGLDPLPLMQAIVDRNLNVQAIYLTHMHFDHIGGVSALQKITKAPIYGNLEDQYLNDIPFKHGGSLEFKELLDFEMTDLKTGRQMLFEKPMMILETPGHTPGSLSFFFPSISSVFVGDLIFMISAGRTDFPGGDHDTLINSVKKRIFILPDETQIFSGHGPMTTVIHEKKNNPIFG